MGKIKFMFFLIMCKDSIIVEGGYANSLEVMLNSYAACFFVFLVSLLNEGINVSNAVLMVNILNSFRCEIW